MPNIEDAIQINISLETTTPAAYDWGIPVIVGEKEITVTNPGVGETRAYQTTTTVNGTESTLVAANKPVLCYSVTDVQKAFGSATTNTAGTVIGSTAVKSAQDLFKQGVRKCYVVAVEAGLAANIGNPLATDYETALNGIVPLAMDSKIAGVILAHQTGIDQLLKLKTFAETYKVLFAATNTPTSSVHSDASSIIAAYITASGGNLKSKYGFFLAGADPSSTSDLAAAALGTMTLYEPWYTMMWKAITSDDTVYFTAAQITILENSGVNGVKLVSGQNVISGGVCTKGSDYLYIDITRTESYLNNQIRDALISLRLKSGKIPYDQSGINIIRGALVGAMDGCAKGGAIASYTVTMPNFSDTTETDRTNRILNNVTVKCRLAGDIHLFVIGLTISM